MSPPVRARQRLSVWLAFLAMWLVVVVPVASQLMAAARAASPDTASVLCSAAVPAGTTAASHRHADGLAACGYCTLLGHQPAMSAPPALFAALNVAQSAPAATLPSAQHIPADFPSGRPRAPPAFSAISAFYA